MPPYFTCILIATHIPLRKRHKRTQTSFWMVFALSVLGSDYYLHRRYLLFLSELRACMKFYSLCIHFNAFCHFLALLCNSRLQAGRPLATFVILMCVLATELRIMCLYAMPRQPNVIVGQMLAANHSRSDFVEGRNIL